MDDERLQLHVRKSRKSAKVTLSGELTIYSAAVLRERLLTVLADCDRLSLDTTKVSELDTAGLQVLLSVQRSCQAQDIPFALAEAGNAVGQTLTLFGLEARFGAPGN